MHIKALTFDVFGTVVDWRGSIIREGELLSQRLGLTTDWARFADGWRRGYVPAMERVARGELAWSTIDQLHRLILDELLSQHSLALPAAEVEHLNQVWHRLQPWPDTVGALNRLRCRYIVSTLSNGNVSLLVNLARNTGLQWDCVLSAELFQRYKPDLAVYRGAAMLLDAPPEEVMMVAAHPGDLAAAREAGLRTAYVHRPLEYGAHRPFTPADPAAFDLVATDMWDLARQLGC